MSVRTERMPNSYNYQRETHRLSTFADWPRDGSTINNVCPLILARLGFIYAGQDDTVVCCHCQTEVKGWRTTDDVRTKHQSCWQQFNSSSEIPSIVSSVRQRLPNRSRTASLSPSTVRRKGDVRDACGDSVPKETTSVVAESNSPFFDMCEEVLCRASRKNFSDIYSNAAVFAAAPAVPADIVIDRTRPDFERLKVESARLATFHDWPETAALIVEPRDLAKAGMFYTGQIDRVQCAFCRGFIRDWAQGDRPADEHRRLFPNCSFVRNADVGLFDVVDNRQVPNKVCNSHR